MKQDDIFKKLNKKKTYIGLQYGKSLISKEIVKYSKEYAPNSKKIPSHVMAFVYNLGRWWAYESTHSEENKYFIPAGVRHYPAEVWLKIEDVKEYSFYEIKLDKERLEYYIGYPYGMGDIKELLLASLKKTNGKQKDRHGLICSEYQSLAYPAITEYYNLPAHCITPAHWQNYVDTLGIEEIILEG